jgi:Tfp pilus tip-associated adhesin PilY1
VVILFTDGVDNNGTSTVNGNTASPYIFSSDKPTPPTPAPSPAPTNPTTSFDATVGNAAIVNSPGTMDTTWWDLFSWAGAAAHLNNTSLTSSMAIPGTYPPTGSNDPKNFLPLAIPSRGDTTNKNFTTFTPPARIQTYTVGVSLGGHFSDASGPKRALFLAAVSGDPAHTHYDDIYQLQPFQLKVPGDASSGPAGNAVFYFDGNDPQALVNNLDYAIASTLHNNTNASTTPNLPFIGASIGQEVYVGEFIPPSSTNPVWPGDLLMFSTRTIGGIPTVVDNTGAAVTQMNSSTAQWSAALAMPIWSSRNLYTRLSGTSGKPEPGLMKFSDLDPDFSALKGSLNKGTLEPMVGTGTDGDKAKTIQWAAGGDVTKTLDSNNRPTTNRATIMGDIINSSPAALEYNLSQVQANANWGNAKNISKFTGAQHFRLIIVGDNQGWLHGFGAVSTSVNVGTDKASGNPITVTQGAVDELWAFMPTDFLPNLDYLQTSNLHRFMVDGAPTIYFLDLPSKGYPNGNGIFDNDNSERALAIFGLRKGGRSYYALNISDPFKPTLQWSLVPDEAALLASKNFTDPVTSASVAAISPDIASGVDVTGIVSKMGLSTCTPAIGRVQYNGYLKDAVFLGGGYSVTELDKNFPVYPVTDSTQKTPLGRSVLALDAWSGQILAAADMTKVSSTIGPIGSSLVPFEFFLNSGMAQRAYFMDLFGGLWSWDQNAVRTTDGSYKGYRTDTSDLHLWSGDQTVKVRKVYQDSTGVTSLYTSLPAPFLLGSFPGSATDSSLARPAAVGILMASGDRNNPIDEKKGYPVGLPTNKSTFRLTAVFDRQDTGLWSSNLTKTGDSYVITDTNLSDFSSTAGGLPINASGADVITPGKPTYYLAPTTGAKNLPDASNTKFGYYIDFPAPVTNGKAELGYFISKSLSDPIVVAGAAFFSYFTPTSAQACGGGDGNTFTNIICDVINPSLSADKATCTTGNALPMASWVGVPSNLTNFGTRGVFQGGVVSVPASGGTPASTKVQFNTLLNSSNNAFPRIRVWRIVH